MHSFAKTVTGFGLLCLCACSSGHNGPAPPAWVGFFPVELERHDGDQVAAVSVESDGEYVGESVGSVSDDTLSRLQGVFYGSSFEDYGKDSTTLIDAEELSDGAVFFRVVVPRPEGPLVDGYFFPGDPELESSTQRMLGVVTAVFNEIGEAE